MKLLLKLITLCVLSTHVYAAEVIHQYDVAINILPSGDINVTETITVNAEGKSIKRGIYRDLPLFKDSPQNFLLTTPYKIISIKRDGKEEPFHTTYIDRAKYLRIYIGDKNYHLPIGEVYTYEIVYLAKKQLSFFEDYDHLYWNAIGAGWEFPIEKANVEISWPESIPMDKLAVFTGDKGSRKGDFEAHRIGKLLNIDSTKVIEPYEGMTIALSFPKGHFIEPFNIRNKSLFLPQYPGLDIALIGLLIMAIYYLFAWTHIGRDPKIRPGIIPYYSPPKRISPAMAAYILHMGENEPETLLSAALISLAAKGYIGINQTGKKSYEIYRVVENEDYKRPKMSKDEKTVYEDIKTSFEITPENKNLVSTAKKHADTIKKKCDDYFFYINTFWWALGIIPILISLFFLSYVHPHVTLDGQPGLYSFDFLFLQLLLEAIAFDFFLSSIRRHKRSRSVWSSVRRLLEALGFLGLFGFFFYMVFIFIPDSSFFTILTLSLMVCLCVSMRILMKAPTQKGQDIKEQIEGLKYYMEAVEEKILKKFNPPEMSRELYETFFPYAVALGVASKWGDKFKKSTGYNLKSNVNIGVSYMVVDGLHGGLFVNHFLSSVSNASVLSETTVLGSVGGGSGGGGGGGW